MHWQHLVCDEIDWHEQQTGALRRTVTEHPAPLDEWRLSAGTHVDFQGLGLVTSGGGHCNDNTLTTGSLVWSANALPLTANDSGMQLYRLLPSVVHQPAQRFVHVPIAQPEWQAFEDPAGRPTQPVQILLDGPLSVLRTRFESSFSAGEHWHDFDTLYFITHGDMQFGEEGQYYSGHVRQVSGGYSYGPERPGPEGVEFVLVSLGGPVALHWADLKPAPNGPLQV